MILREQRISRSKLLYKKLFLKISQVSQENVCVRVSFYQVTGLELAPLLKEFPAQVFPCEFSKFFKTIILQNTSGRLLLDEITCHAVIDQQVKSKTFYIFFSNIKFNFKPFLKICSEIAIKMKKRRQWHLSTAFIVNIEYIEHYNNRTRIKTL